VAYKLLYHEDSLVDLEIILEWSRERHPATTERFADDLLNHLDLLTVFPNIGTPIKGKPDLRRLLHSPFYVYYRIDNIRGAIEILHFWHSARRPPQL
jgi:plasmid stabilization system protein ParE